jgi:mono/diheme cytochrome c family protein
MSASADRMGLETNDLSRSPRRTSARTQLVNSLIGVFTMHSKAERRRATQRRVHRLLLPTVMVLVGSCVRSGAPAAAPPSSAPPAAIVSSPSPPSPPSPAALDSATLRASGAGRGAAPRDPFEGADLSAKPPVTPLSPTDEATHFQLPPGYHLQPILSEPAIQQPAAVSFDGNGRMFVLELRSYMLDADATNQLAPVSRISRWEDRDRDGVYETHTVFVDSLVFPRFVTPYGANAVLTMESNSNDVFKYTDTNGDGRADKKELFTSNFGRLANVEHLQSSLFWAMDNWLYSTVNAFRVRETKTGVIREATGFNGAQWGASQDDEGKIWFQGGASGVPSYFQFPIVYGNFNVPNQYEPGFDDIWGAPVKLADMQGGMGIVRMPDGSLSRATAGSGANVYRGGRLPADLRGDYFYGEVVGRVVRRVRPVTTEGITQLRNVYQPAKSEFIRSTDPLFRPVEIKTAPDGSMYIVDMYHGIIQESQWTPKGSYLRAKIEQYQLDKLVGLGRIWRLTSDAAPRDKAPPRMLNERPAQLVRHLQHPNSWWRDMAQQLLVLKHDKSVAPALRTMARRDTMLVARFHALWTLEGLGALDTAFVREQMRDPGPRMRIQAIRASETLYKDGDKTLGADYRRLAADADPDVAIQAMLTINTLKVPDAQEALRAAMASTPARGVKLVADQILNPPPDNGARGPGTRNFTDPQRGMIATGATVYMETCAQCHGETGLGKSAANGQLIAPPLAGNPHVTGYPDWVIRTLLHGLTGPINGQSYAGLIMVPQKGQSDEWIATMASYVRNTLTNQASFVTAEQVAKIRVASQARKTPWTYAELTALVPVQMSVQSTWRATASDNSPSAVRAFGTAGWSSMMPQRPDMWFQVELPQAVTLAEIQFQSGGFGGGRAANAPPPPTPFPRAYRVQVSTDGNTWSAPVAEEKGVAGFNVISLKPVRAKFIRFTQTASVENAPPWSMQQLQLYELRPSN